MFTIKNAIKNIYRYRNKYTLFVVLYLALVLGASVCVALFVRMGQMTDNIIREYANVALLDGGVRERIDEIYTIARRFRKEEYLQLKDTPHIDDIRFLRYNFSTGIGNLSEGFDLSVGLSISGNIVNMYNTHWDAVYILGYNMSLLHLVPDNFNIERGRMFENNGEAVIARNTISRTDRYKWDSDLGIYVEHRTWIDLDLGDKIIIRNDNGIHKEFTVVGIQAEDSDNTEHTNRRMIYTTLESAEYFSNIASDNPINALTAAGGIAAMPAGRDLRWNLNPLNWVRLGYTVLAYFDYPENLFAVGNVAGNMILADGASFAIIPLHEDFNAIVRLSNNLRVSSIVFTILTALIIIAVTIITTLMLLNSRKYEIAVLRSNGAKKSRLILSYLIENLVFIWGISIVSLIAAQFIAPRFTSGVFEGLREMVSPEMFEQLTSVANVSLILQNVGWVFAGATAIVALSLMIACVNIMRFEPLKIFNKQY